MASNAPSVDIQENSLRRLLETLTTTSDEAKKTEIIGEISVLYPQMVDFIKGTNMHNKVTACEMVSRFFSARVLDLSRSIIENTPLYHTLISAARPVPEQPGQELIPEQQLQCTINQHVLQSFVQLFSLPQLVQSFYTVPKITSLLSFLLMLYQGPQSPLAIYIINALSNLAGAAPEFRRVVAGNSRAISILVDLVACGQPKMPELQTLAIIALYNLSLDGIARGKLIEGDAVQVTVLRLLDVRDDSSPEASATAPRADSTPPPQQDQLSLLRLLGQLLRDRDADALHRFRMALGEPALLRLLHKSPHRDVQAAAAVVLQTSVNESGAPPARPTPQELALSMHNLGIAEADLDLQRDFPKIFLEVQRLRMTAATKEMVEKPVTMEDVQRASQGE